MHLARKAAWATLIGTGVLAVGLFLEQAALFLTGLTLLGFGALCWALASHLARSEARVDAAEAHLQRTLEDLHRSHAELAEQNARFDTALENIGQGLCFFDGSSRIIVSNRLYASLYGLTPDQVKRGTLLSDIIAARVAIGTGPAEMTGEAYLRWRDSIAKAGPDSPVDTEVLLQDGRIIAIHHRPLPDGGWVATHEDVTARRHTENRIVHMARHDALTGLPNRVLFHERLRETLGPASDRSGTGGRGAAVLCLDLDHFKHVNDTLGHAVGDALLQKVAERVRTVAGESEGQRALVARLGGDEFAMIWTPDLTGPDLVLAESAAWLAEQVVSAVSQPYWFDGQQVVIGASVGIALAPQDGADSYALLKMADLALYRAKARGRGTYQRYEEAMNAEAQARRALEVDLRQALARGEFELHYQPLLNLPTNRISGFEALLRWRHPERGLVAPADFVSLAEEIGLIVPLGEWVLRTACAEATTWPDHLKVAVNLSPAQFKSRMLTTSVVQTLAATGLLPQRLELEITESVLLDPTDGNIEQLHQLRSLGVRIAMDDFGTGYSSLSYLRSFPFDKIKIDRSFVNDLVAPTGEALVSGAADTSQQGVAIVRAVAGLGASLGMCITAEGVETAEQLDLVRAEGCTEVQGYHLSRPRPASDIPALLDAGGLLSARQRAA